jgi:septum formation protein
MSALQKLILASGSPRRVELLQQAGVEPQALVPTDIDEEPKRSEHPRSLAKRLATEKAKAARRILEQEKKADDAFILAADTVVAVGRRVLPKADYVDEATACLRLLSGRTHRVYTAVTLINPSGRERQKLVESRVRFKRLSREEIDSYLASGEWRGKAGGYAIQGFAGTFVAKITGSYSNVVGLPLYETVSLLAGEGYRVHLNWLSGQGNPV